jgi:hypothetical protein
MRVQKFQEQGGASPILIDPYRAFVFPNRLRQLRRTAGYPTLLALAREVPAIPYIRLSKIERGEIFARSDELRVLGSLLSIPPDCLLIDINSEEFDLAEWARPFFSADSTDEAEEHFAVKIAAAIRAKRSADRSLSAATLEERFGIPPVILSRIENAHKVFDRWNPGTVQAICRFFGVEDASALRAAVEQSYVAGELDSFIPLVSNPTQRKAKTRRKVMELQEELGIPIRDVSSTDHGEQSEADSGTEPSHSRRQELPKAGASGGKMLPLYGAPRVDGSIALTPAYPAFVEAMPGVGPRAFALKMCRSTMGIALPARGILIIDPDVFPCSGSLGVLREGDAYRLLAITMNRAGSLKGVSLNPDIEIDLDAMMPDQLAGVVGILFD